MPPALSPTLPRPAHETEPHPSSGGVWGRLVLGLTLLVGSGSPSEAQEGSRPGPPIGGANLDDLPRFALPNCADIPWSTARDLRIALPAEHVRDDCLYREVPGNSLHADHRNRTVIEVQGADGRPSGCLVLDFAREEWRVIARKTYNQDAFRVLEAHFGRNHLPGWEEALQHFQSIPANERNYELFVAPTEGNEGLHRAIKSASDFVLLDKILGAGDVHDLLSEKSSGKRAYLHRITELARACAIDPELHNQLEGLVIARGLSLDARNRAIPLIRDLSESMRVGLGKLCEVFASEIVELSTRRKGDQFTLVCSLLGKADRQFEITVALDEKEGFQFANAKVQLGVDEPRAILQVPASGRITPITFSRLVERVTLAQAAEIAKLEWHSVQELSELKDLSRFPDVAESLAKPDIIAREIPEHLRYAKHRGPDIRVIEFATRSDAFTPLACVVLDTSAVEPKVREARCYHPDVLDRYQADFPRMPIDLRKIASTLEGISSREREITEYFLAPRTYTMSFTTASPQHQRCCHFPRALSRSEAPSDSLNYH